MLEYVLKQLKDPEEFGRKVAYLYEHRTEKSREEIEFADGRYLDRYSSPLLSTDGQYLGRIWFFRDITDQKRAEEWLLRERSMLDRIMKTSPAGIMVVDRKRQIVFTNKRAEDIFCLTKNEITQRGYSASEWHITDFDGNPLPEEQLPFTQVMNTGNPVYGIRHAVALSDGRRVFLSINGAPVSDEQGNISEVVLTIDDITDRIRMEEERQKLEERLRMSQRLEAIGTLAGGIAHDFNNILSAVMGFAEMALDETAGDTPSHQYLSEILHAGRRARDLVRQILTFSRQAEYEKNPIQVKPIVKETIKFLRASIPVSIDIQQKIESDSMVPADPTQLHQIIMNLCTNAAHAMEKGGTLEVSLSDVEMDEDAASIYPGMVPGRHLRLRVSDTGCGMTPEVMERIFEPFFTTKPRGEGTGMGLAVVHGIVKEYAGVISVHSELGKGSAFHVYLPVIEAMEDAAGELSEALLTGTERILFVDDEELLVKLGKKMLERLGYQVTTQTSPLVALDLFRNKPDAFDLVITDVTMPKMTGDELAKELLKIRPDIPVILCTGFSARMSDEKARELGIKAFIMKPTLIQEIARTIRKVLGE
jgi:PAS domain S-box-containing protein